MNSLGQVYHVKWFSAQKVEFPQLAANQTEPENQAGPVAGPDPNPSKKISIFF